MRERERERERETYQLVQKRRRRGVAGRRSGGARWLVIFAVGMGIFFFFFLKPMHLGIGFDKMGFLCEGLKNG